MTANDATDPGSPRIAHAVLAAALAAALATPWAWATLGLGWMTDDPTWWVAAHAAGSKAWFWQCGGFGVRTPLADLTWRVVAGAGGDLGTMRVVQAAHVLALAAAAAFAGVAWGARWWWAGLLASLAPVAGGGVEALVQLSSLSYLQVTIGALLVLATGRRFFDAPSPDHAVALVGASMLMATARTQGVLLPVLLAGMLVARPPAPATRRTVALVVGAALLPWLQQTWVDLSDPTCLQFLHDREPAAVAWPERLLRGLAGVVVVDGGYGFGAPLPANLLDTWNRPELRRGLSLAAAALGIGFARDRRATALIAAWWVLQGVLVARFAGGTELAARHVFFGAATVWTLAAVIGLGHLVDVRVRPVRLLAILTALVGSLFVAESAVRALQGPCLTTSADTAAALETLAEDVAAQAAAGTPVDAHAVVAGGDCTLAPSCPEVDAWITRRHGAHFGALGVACTDTRLDDGRREVRVVTTP